MLVWMDQVVPPRIFGSAPTPRKNSPLNFTLTQKFLIGFTVKCLKSIFKPKSRLPDNSDRKLTNQISARFVLRLTDFFVFCSSDLQVGHTVFAVFGFKKFAQKKGFVILHKRRKKLTVSACCF